MGSNSEIVVYSVGGIDHIKISVSKFDAWLSLPKEKCPIIALTVPSCAREETEIS